MTYEVYLKQNPYHAGPYKIYLRDGQGRNTLSYARAKRLKITFQGKTVVPWQAFPQGVSQKKIYASGLIEEFEEKRITRGLKLLLPRLKRSLVLKKKSLLLASRQLQSFKITKVGKTQKSKEKRLKQLALQKDLRKKISSLKSEIQKNETKLRVSKAQLKPSILKQKKVTREKKKKALEEEIVSEPTEKVRILSKRVFSSQAEKPHDLHIKILEMIHDPKPFTRYTIQSVVAGQMPLYKKIFDEQFLILKKSQKRLILRLLYRQRLSDGTQVIRGFGTARSDVKTLKALQAALVELALTFQSRFTDLNTGYFTKGMMPEVVELVGATMEWIVKTEKPLAGKALARRLKEWNEEKKKMRAKAYRSRNRTLYG